MHSHQKLKKHIQQTKQKVLIIIRLIKIQWQRNTEINKNSLAKQYKNSIKGHMNNKRKI